MMKFGNLALALVSTAVVRASTGRDELLPERSPKQGERSLATCPCDHPNAILGMVTESALNAAGEMPRVAVFDDSQDPPLCCGDIRIPSGSKRLFDCSVQDNLGFVTNFEDKLNIIDLSDPCDPQLLAAVTISTLSENTAITVDGKHVLVCNGGANDPISVVDIEMQQEVSTFPLTSNCVEVEVCSDGTVLAADYEEGEVRRLTIDENGTLADTGFKLSLSFSSSQSELRNLACSPDSQFGSAIFERNPPQVLSFKTGDMTQVSMTTFTGGTGRGVTVGFNADGTVLFAREQQAILRAFQFNYTSGVIGAPIYDINLASQPVNVGVDSFELNPLGSRLYASNGGALDYYNPDSGAFLGNVTNLPVASDLWNGICFDVNVTLPSESPSLAPTFTPTKPSKGAKSSAPKMAKASASVPRAPKTAKAISSKPEGTRGPKASAKGRA